MLLDDDQNTLSCGSCGMAFFPVAQVLDTRLDANSIGFSPFPHAPRTNHEHATIVRKLAGPHSLNVLACVL